MLVYKSFFRKKTTKIYLLVYILILLVIFLLLFTKLTLEEKENDSYNGSFIEIITKEESQLENIKNVNTIEKALVVKEDKVNENMLINNQRYGLDNFEVVVSSKLKKEIKINDVFEISLNNELITLKVKDFDENISNYIFYVSKYLFDKYENNTDASYILTLKKWSKIDDTLVELRKLYKNENVIYHNYETNSSYSMYIAVINVMLLVLLFLFSIVLIVTCFNIIQDENKINIIYYKLGYIKRKLKLFNVIKISSLLFISVFISGFLLYLMLLIYNNVF